MVADDKSIDVKADGRESVNSVELVTIATYFVLML